MSFASLKEITKHDKVEFFSNPSNYSQANLAPVNASSMHVATMPMGSPYEVQGSETMAAMNLPVSYPTRNVYRPDQPTSDFHPYTTMPVATTTRGFHSCDSVKQHVSTCSQCNLGLNHPYENSSSNSVSSSSSSSKTTVDDVFEIGTFVSLGLFLMWCLQKK